MELQKIEEYIPMATMSQSLAIWGPATIGKTWLALQLGEARKEKYRTSVLFEASSELQLRASIDEFYRFLVSQDDEHLNTAGNASPDLIGDRCNAVREWFETEVDWLIIYDNVHVNKDGSTPIDSYRPQKGKGHQILISRDPEIVDHAKRRYKLGPMDKTDAVQMLRSVAEVSEDQESLDADSLSTIVELLRRVPGAIHIAGMYILTRGILPKDYVPMLIDKQENMRKESTTNEKGHEFAAWHITLDELKESSPDALYLLQFLVMLQGSGIPKEL